MIIDGVVVVVIDVIFAARKARRGDAIV